MALKLKLKRAPNEIDESKTGRKEEFRGAHKETAKLVKFRGTAEARRLYEKFQYFNKTFFHGELASPLVLITSTGSPRVYGDYTCRDPHGLESRIRMAPLVIAKGPKFADDVLLHEMIHAWQWEVNGDVEPGYRGHGPVFAAKCNQIGKVLGIPKVGVKGRDGLPKCDYWPMIVREPGHYPQGDFEPPKREPRKTEAEKEMERKLTDRLEKALVKVPTKTLRMFHTALGRVVRERRKNE